MGLIRRNVQDSRFMQPFDGSRGGDPHRADEQLRPILDRDLDELVELAVGVIVVCFAGGAADLGEGEVDAEGERFVGEIRFELVDDVLELLGGVAQTADDT